MKKYTEKKIREDKEINYRTIISRIRDDGSLKMIQRAESLKGRITATPTYTPRLIEIRAFQDIEPILYH